MRLRPLYTLRYFYPQDYGVEVKNPEDKSALGKDEQLFFFSEGSCEGLISGRFKGANHPRRRADNTYEMDMQGFIETDDGAQVMADFQGYGRSSWRSSQLYGQAAPEKAKSRRQVVGFVRHYAEAEKYRWLNDALCALAGEVRVPPEIPPEQLKQADVKLVFSVAELVWEAPPE